jgi:DtxR family transcriptional regulator, Mn-dependent transcriptional regulator
MGGSKAVTESGPRREAPAPEGSHGRGRRQGGQEAVEDYAKAIYALVEHGDGPVTTSALAGRLGVAPGTVTAMLKRLSKLGLIDYEPYRGVELTAAGERVALEVIRHHRLIEAYLAEALGMPWDRVHDEAEVLEHYISEDLEERMAAALGHPDRDPHGDPIPDRRLSIEGEGGISLAGLEQGQGGTFTRVSDGEPEMLRYLADRDIRPGVRLRVAGREPFGGPVVIVVGDREHAIGEGLAERMLIATDELD